MPSAEQLEVFNDIITSALDDLNLSSLNNNDISIDIKTCRDSFDDLAMAAEIVDLQTLGEICKAYSENFFNHQDDSSTLSLEKAQDLNTWSKNLISYIRSPQNTEFAINLTTIFPKEIKEHFLKSLIGDEVDSTLSTHTDDNDDTENTKHVIDIPLSTPSNDPIYLFISELNEMEKKLDDCLVSILTASREDADKHIGKYLHFITRIHDTAEILGMSGLIYICQFIDKNMQAINIDDENLRPIYFELFSPIPSLIVKFLSNMGDTENILDIVTLFEHEDWPKNNGEDDSHQLIILLSDNETLDLEENIEEDKKINASKNDVSLILSSDIHPDLFSAFFHDAPNQASSLSACIASFVGSNNASSTIENIENAQRLTHAIKGSANIVELFGIANMTHYLEEALESLRLSKAPPKPQFIDLLQQSSDCIESMIDYLMGKDVEPKNAQELLQQLLDTVNGSDKGDNTHASNYENNHESIHKDCNDEIIAESSINSLPSLLSTSEPGEPATEIDSSVTTEKVHEDFIQVPTQTIESLFEMVEEITISLIQTREQVKTMMENANNQSIQDEKIQEHRFELEKIVDIKALSSSKKRNVIKNDPSNSNFDSLELDQYSEIHGTVHSFIETVIDSRELNIDMRDQLLQLDHLFVKHMRLNKGLQYLTKSTKMVSVTSISSRLQRCMRHAARITQKNVNLTIVDNGLSIDEEVLSQLTDPLMHIIRNAIDHGIELPECRDDLGKPNSGNISIIFSQSGNHIHIQCKDDGQGINPTSIYTTALEKGLISEDQILDQKDCIDLLLTSGFTTKDNANQISGRGVGLDAVNENIKKLNGKIDIDSKLDIGTSIKVTVPLSHLSTHAIIISLNYERYAVPSHSLRQLLAPHSGEVVNYGLEVGYKHNDITYPLITIADLLLGQNNLNKQHITVDNLPIILLDVNNTTYALAVDSIQSNQEIIIKPMGNYINKTHGVNGVAIIADGTLISVLDIAELIDITPGAAINDSDNASYSLNKNVFIPQQQIPDKPSIMIVDDSLSVRRSLEQLINDMGYDTLVAQDGIHAVELCKQKMPDIILSDMEMPRMNGLELTSYIKKSASLKHIPVVMITSRSTQKHRQLATQSGVDHYLTKPYTESQLLDLVGSLIPQKNTLQ
ncbi:hypothetical protein A9Q81_23200 [Gammaproteobacteria bacterium 42_54_T18]|nr:hypothetical protein A9Q81_23200 [Gammaproteobacteria bacterium 42_54_T18]